MNVIEHYRYPVPAMRLYSRHTPATYMRSMRHTGTHRVLQERKPTMHFRKAKLIVASVATAMVAMQIANTALISLVLWKVW